MKHFVLLFLILGACTSSPKVEDSSLLEVQDNQGAQFDKTTLDAAKNIALGGAGYAVSLPLAGAAYTIDGTLYFVSGTAATIIYCWPLATALATRSSQGMPVYGLCFNPKPAYKMIGRYHPHVGRKLWEATESWRLPLNQEL